PARDVSQMVIQEVSVIQEDLEIERMCRESAEALASKLNRQNRSLKRKSMMLMSHLSPETITEISLVDDEEEGEDLDANSKHCHLFTHVRDSLLYETCRYRKEEKHDNTMLIAEIMQQKKLLQKYNRVSQFAVEEYEALQETLDLEQNLRTEAENFARAMLVEQKKLKRQSQILMQNSATTQALQDALSQIASLTEELETERLEHQKQVCAHQHSVWGTRKGSKALGFEELQKKLQAAVNPPPTPASAPPPPPPPPPTSSASNPLRLVRFASPLRTFCFFFVFCTKIDLYTSFLDIRQQAVDEMMQRIKKGVQLRPVRQSPCRARRQVLV
uniref:Shootin-1 n=1 Tax=Oryzias sinensis TaxID=183150 RepID=A0A8C7Y9Z9_9TELE